MTSFLNRFWPWIILAITGTAWGLTFSLTKLATDTGAAIIGIAFWQTLLSGIMLMVYAYARNGHIGIKIRHLPLIAIVSLTGVLVPGLIFYEATRHVQPGILAIADTLVPMLTFALALIIGLEKSSLRRLAGLFAGITGILLLVVPENSLPDRAATLWVIFSCFGAACYAFENLIIDAFKPDDLGPIRLSVGMNIFAAFILFPLALATDSFFVPQFPPGVLEWSLLSIALISAIGYSSFVFLIVTTGPVFASQVGFMVTVTGVLWGIVIFQDEYSGTVWLALVIMMAGLALVTPRKDNTPVPPLPPSGVKPFPPPSD